MLHFFDANFGDNITLDYYGLTSVTITQFILHLGDAGILDGDQKTTHLCLITIPNAGSNECFHY